MNLTITHLEGTIAQSIVIAKNLNAKIDAELAKPDLSPSNIKALATAAKTVLELVKGLSTRYHAQAHPEVDVTDFGSDWDDAMLSKELAALK